MNNVSAVTIWTNVGISLFVEQIDEILLLYFGVSVLAGDLSDVCFTESGVIDGLLWL